MSYVIIICKSNNEKKVTIRTVATRKIFCYQNLYVPLLRSMSAKMEFWRHGTSNPLVDKIN